MVEVEFIEGFENCSQLNASQIQKVAQIITSKAALRRNIQEYLRNKGKSLDKIFVSFCDIDRIYLTLDPAAVPDCNEDFIIRTWDYRISDENPKALSIEWSFHCMGESCSEEHCYGADEIVIFK